MSQLKKFKVLPNIPDKLKPLAEIAQNLWPTWNAEALRLFFHLDPILWDRTNHNPVRMLSEINQQRLDELSEDTDYLNRVDEVYKNWHRYLEEGNGRAKINNSHVAYFSLEFGLSESLPLYSGGLGILAGDFVKSASDLGLNLTGVGLLYQLGYFQQYLNQDGWQQDFYQVNDFFNMGVKKVKLENGDDLEIEIKFLDRKLVLKVWKIIVGRIKLYLLDSNLEKNSEEDRKITGQLYGGNREMRLKQEIVVGIGGVRLLDKLEIPFEVLHMNEGHSAFATLERTRLLMDKFGLHLNEAFEVVRRTSVFTTHTPVPAGNDTFVPDLIGKYFNDYASKLNISLQDFLNMGRVFPDNHSENFSMTVAALKNSFYINGVSRLHTEVSRKMWQNIWRDIPEEHIPIQAITNGIHMASWMSFDLTELLDTHFGENWQEKQDSTSLWDGIRNIPDAELWKVHEIRRKKLINFTRKRLKKQLLKKGSSRLLVEQAQDVLDYNSLTIGLARRFATYKRGDLILREPERLLKLINDSQRPVQLIFAGKAHPQDNSGKEIIKNIVHFINSNQLTDKMVFIEDYDINVARYMVQGVDVWLNNPLRPFEACGTSGMKAAVNGVLNLSVLDGWWDEAFNHSNGWAIGKGEIYQDKNYQSQVESKMLYTILEKKIIPRFYDQREKDLPVEWIKMMKNSFLSLVSFYNTHRMVKDYYSRFYKEAARFYQKQTKNGFREIKEFVKWKITLEKEFNSVKIDKFDFNKKVFRIGEEFKIEADVFLGNINTKDIRIDVYHGNVAPDGQIEDAAVINLENFTQLDDNRYRYSGNMVCQKTGEQAFKLRIIPYHPLCQDPYEMNLVKWG